MFKILQNIIAAVIIAIIAVPAQIIPTAHALDEATNLIDATGQPAAATGVLPAADPPNTIQGPGLARTITNPVLHIGSLALNAISGSSAGLLRQDLFKWAQEFVLEKLKKKILDMMVDDIVRWVQGGDEPKFVTDWGQFLEDAGNVALGDLAVRVAGAGICEPFKSSLLQNLTVPEPERFSSNSLYGSSITCTLDEIVDNIQSFNEDFRNGGWRAYSESLKVQNDPVALLVMTQNAKFQAIGAAQRAAELEALSGRGFLSTKTCFEDPKSDGPDLDGDKTKGDVASTCRITTPGATIGDLVGKAVGSDIDYIVNAQQLAAYVSAITDALWNRLIHETTGLIGISTDNAPGGHTPNNPADDFIPEGAEGCQALGSPNLIDACENYVESNRNNFTITRANLLADIETVRAGLLDLRDALIEWKEVADELNEFIIEESQDRPAACIADALEQHFNNNTPAGVAAYTASINTQLEIVNARLAALDDYEGDLAAIPANAPNTWADFTVLASTIETQLTTMHVSEDADEQALAQKGELEIAYEVDIRPDVLMCH